MMSLLKTKHISFSSLAVMVLGIFVLCTLSGPLVAQNAQIDPPSEVAQETKPQNKVFKATVRATDATILLTGKTQIHLWGIQSIDYMPAPFRLRVRTALDNIIGSSQVECELKERTPGKVRAQCVNAAQQDLGLYLLQQGFVSAERADIYGTVFEGAYIQAETDAQSRELGLWDASSNAGSGGSMVSNPNLFLSFSFLLFICIVAAFIALSVIMMRGFNKVVDAQNQNVEFMSRERELRDQERGIVATMIDSELKANKAKMEAYLVVYEEMLKALKDPERPPKYKKSGDIVQKQPAVDRSVFARNTDKLDTLGEELSNNLIHFYARFKSTPEYINLEPDMDLPQAIGVVETAVNNAKRLDKIAEGLLESFQSAHLKLSGYK